MMKRIFLFAAICFALSTPAYAQDGAEKPVAADPVSKWVNAENALIKPLSKADKETFFIIRNKHNVIRALRVVRDDISKAVKGCGKENDTIKAEMETRYDDWDNAVSPILKEADKYLKQEIKAQTIVSSSDFRNVLKLNDKAYAYTNSQIEKRPVTDEKSCKKLLASMDRTENELISLLQNILLPEEVVRERMEQEEKKKKSSAKDS